MAWGRVGLFALGAGAFACGGIAASSASDAGTGPETAATTTASTTITPPPPVKPPPPPTPPPPVDAGPDACTTDLSNIGTGDFHIDFKIRTTATGLSTIAYQRTICDHDEFWDVRMNPGGKIGIETDNSGAHYTAVISDEPVDDGAVHAIAIARVAGVLRLYIDGVLENAASSTTNFGALPKLGIASGDPCENGHGTVPFVGDLTELCIRAK